MIRLFVDGDLTPGARLLLEAEQTHYLVRVMRLSVGDPLFVFNGRDGEWRASLVDVAKRRCVLVADAPTRAQASAPDVDLLIALVKRARLETIIEKAVELGARRVGLVTTERTNADHANVARLGAIATEAAEQTGRLEVPWIDAPLPLPAALNALSPGRRVMFCDEAGDAAPAGEALRAAPAASWAVLVGPEGGFSARERTLLLGLAHTTAVSLGPRILRADTAAISALTLWQSTLGDWRGA